MIDNIKVKFNAIESVMDNLSWRIENIDKDLEEDDDSFYSKTSKFQKVIYTDLYDYLLKKIQEYLKD